MNKKVSGDCIETGVLNFDVLFPSGIPKGSISIVAGSPGSGKTIFAQQICFRNATSHGPALYFATPSEPAAKTLRYLKQFKFFDAKKLESGVQFIDLGAILQSRSLEEIAKLILEHVKRLKPAIVVIDSFKVFDDLAQSRGESRRFCYDLGVSLMAWETTAFLLGEYSGEDIQLNPLFSIVDGLITMGQRVQSRELQRFIQVVKMRGTDHSREEHPFVISSSGISVFAPRVTIQREEQKTEGFRCRTGIVKFDELLGEGIPSGSSLLVSGVAGTGKTVLLLEFIYRGALAGEKGIIFSFEETKERLLATARGMGWDLDRQIELGMVEIEFIPQPSITVEQHLLMMTEQIESGKVRRVAVDSLSVFLHKIQDRQIAREKVFQLASVIQNRQAVGFFAVDIPYGSRQVSRFGVEETVVDGVILLTSSEEGLERERYLEVYKLRNTAHSKGRHSMVIAHGGIFIFPRYGVEAKLAKLLPRAPAKPHRLASGVPGLDGLCGGGLLDGSVTLVSGSAGIGKSTLGLQFLVEGANLKEPGLYVALEERPDQIAATARGLGLSLDNARDRGAVEILRLSSELTRPSQFLAILSDKISATKARRLVLDSVSHLGTETAGAPRVREMLRDLVVRFKTLGVTSLLTQEAPELFSLETITSGGFSAIADNILMLRYLTSSGEICPTLTVMKTRGGPHDRRTHFFSIGKGGIRIGEPVTPVSIEKTPRARGRPKK